MVTGPKLHNIVVLEKRRSELGRQRNSHESYKKSQQVIHVSDSREMLDISLIVKQVY